MPEVGVNFTNTPGVYYFLAYFLSSCLYISLNPKRFKGAKLAGILLLFFVVLGSIMISTDQITVVLFIPCVLLEIFILWLSIYICCDFSWRNATYFCIRAFILGEFAASLEWQLYYYGLTNLHLEPKLGYNLLFLLISHTVVFGTMYFLEKRYAERNSTFQVTGKDIGISAFLGIFVYVLSNMSYVFENTPFSSRFPTEIFIIRTLTDLGGVGMLFAYHMQLQELNMRVEKNFLENILHMQYQNYKISEESIALVNQKYHDLKHQIALLRSVTDLEEKNAYLDWLEQEIRTYEAQNKTGNKVLDTILTTKSLQCQNQGISLTCVADGKEIEFMHPMDISALFGNALDNAIESVKKIADPDKRLIHLSVARQKGFLRIRVENCYEGELRFENGIPRTTKADRKFHGFGMKSIQRIAEKYNGSVTIDTEDGWFELRILIPL